MHERNKLITGVYKCIHAFELKSYLGKMQHSENNNAPFLIMKLQKQKRQKVLRYAYKCNSKISNLTKKDFGLQLA